MIDPFTPLPKLYYEEDQIAEFARLIYVAAREHEASYWTIDLIKGGLDSRSLRTMAGQWREFGFQPEGFAAEVDRLADALATSG